MGHAPKMGESVISRRSVWALGLAGLLSGTVGCSAASVTAAPGQAAASLRHSQATPSTSSTPSADVGGLGVISGYTYTVLSPKRQQAVERGAHLSDVSGMVTLTAARVVRDSSGAVVGTIMLFQSTPKMTASLDKMPSKLLDGIVETVRTQLPDKGSVTSYLLSGTQVRMLQSARLSAAVAYRHGGKVFEIIGSKSGPVLRFLGALFAAGATQ